jgi:Bacterial Ig-like domain (group 2).
MKKLLSIILLITAVVFNSCKDDDTKGMNLQKSSLKKVKSMSYLFNSGAKNGAVKSSTLADSTTASLETELSVDTWEENGELFTATLIEDNDPVITKATQGISGSGVYTFYAYKDSEIKPQAITADNRVFQVPVDAATKYGIIFLSTVSGVPEASRLNLNHADKEITYQAKFNENLCYKLFDKSSMPNDKDVNIEFKPVFSQLGVAVPRKLVSSTVKVEQVRLIGGAQKAANVKIKYNSQAISNISVSYDVDNTDYQVDLNSEVNTTNDSTILVGRYYNLIPNGNKAKIYIRMSTNPGIISEKEFELKDKDGKAIIFEPLKRYKLTIENRALESIEIHPAESKVIKGGTVNLKLIANYYGGVVADITEDAEWKSGTISAVTVSSTAGTKGLATGVGVGESTITATFGAKEATAKVIVSNEIDRIEISPDPASVVKGKTVQLKATAFFQDGTDRDVTKEATWTSETVSIATIGAKTGLAKGEKVGTTKITATYNGKSGTKDLTVTNEVVGIVVEPNPSKVIKGGTIPLTATATLEDGTEQDVTKLATWTTESSTIATVGEKTGIVKGLEIGTTVITASYGGDKGISELTVTNDATSIKVTPEKSTIIKGKSVQLKAIVIYEDKTEKDITKIAKWTSQTTTAATVGVNTGLVKGVEVGKSIVLVEYEGQVGSAEITVTNNVKEIKVAPATSTLIKGKQFN